MKKNVVIIGLGLIGGSLAKAFQKYSECSVSGMDRDPAVLDAALKLSLIHISSSSPCSQSASTAGRFVID